MARVAVIGAGVTGLVAALRLAQGGDEVVVYERWPGLGGMAATLDVGGGHRLERYYHHWFTSDRHVLALCEELGVALDWLPSSVGFYAGGVLHPFTTPLDLLRFSPLPPATRLRMGLAVVRLQRFGPPSAGCEGETAEAGGRAHMGDGAGEPAGEPPRRLQFGPPPGDGPLPGLQSSLSA